MEPTVTEVPSPGKEGVASERVSQLLRRALRIVVTLHALDAFAQPVLAGRFLSGDYGMLGTHASNAIIVTTIGFVQTILAVLYWRPGGGLGWPALVALGISVAEPIQIALGFNRLAGVHIPLGVAIVTAAILMLLWAWVPAYGRRRAAGRSAA